MSLESCEVLEEAVVYGFDTLKLVCETFLAVGVDRGEIIAELSSFRNSVSNDKEETILDVLDCLSGWCSPHSKIL
ncbi:MAG: hypothetical protein GY861_21925 [bacterium]|nr:hypothetical protein [bacterium]